MGKKSFVVFPFLSLFTAVTILAGCSDDKEATKKEETEIQKEAASVAEIEEAATVVKEDTEERDKGGYIIDQQLPEKPHYEKDILVANKKYPLPASYNPGENSEARQAYEQLNIAAQQKGYHFTAFSTFRPYDRQKELYDGYVAKDGQEKADTYSARPGYSEHQTGLAFDIGDVNYPDTNASSRFGELESGKWLAENAHKYGFILRYPEGKEDITGYMYEAWHFRYVGKEIATEIYKNDSTLEEYLGVSG